VPHVRLDRPGVLPLGSEVVLRGVPQLCGWTGNPIPVSLPARATIFLAAESVRGPFLSVENTYGESGYSRVRRSLFVTLRGGNFPVFDVRGISITCPISLVPPVFLPSVFPVMGLFQERSISRFLPFPVR